MTLSQTYRSALMAGFLLTAVFPTGAAAQSNSPQGVINVVIVHGAWADGSSWSKVIPLLQARGLHVVAVQNPLTSLADDVAATKARHRRVSPLLRSPNRSRRLRWAARSGRMRKVF
jgi:pimeloyl-ACP methyl ester carboxylesterase